MKRNRIEQHREIRFPVIKLRNYRFNVGITFFFKGYIKTFRKEHTFLKWNF